MLYREGQHMTTVPQAFQQFVSSLELTQTERDNAVAQHQVVRQRVRAELRGVDDDFLSGSYARATAIRPLHDIDVFVVLNDATHGHLRRGRPDACLAAVQSALARAYRDRPPPVLQGRSVNITFVGTGIGYDIVPAFRVSSDLFIIPDRERQNWIQTNPKKHGEACVAANQRAGGKLNPLIKAVKHWNAQRACPLRSFHLEVMSYEAFPTPPTSYGDAMRILLAFLADRVQLTCPEPAGVGPHIDNAMTQGERATARAALTEATKRAADGIAYDRAGKLEEAHTCWRTLFGTAYPERGR